MGIFQSIFLFLRAFIMGRAAAAVENLALRQQVAVFKQSVKRPKLRPRDRVFWVHRVTWRPLRWARSSRFRRLAACITDTRVLRDG